MRNLSQTPKTTGGMRSQLPTCQPASVSRTVRRWLGTKMDSRKNEGQYDEGQPVGQFVSWHPNGNKQIVGMYGKGKKNGRWTWWYANGMKQYDGQYKDDEPVGNWRSWSTTGKLLKKENFSKNEEDESTKANSNGQSIIDPATTGAEGQGNASDPTPTAEVNGDASSENAATGDEEENMEELPDPEMHDFGTPDGSDSPSEPATPADASENAEDIGALPSVPDTSGSPD